MKIPAKDLPLYCEFPEKKYRYELIPNKRGYLECLISPYRKSAQDAFYKMTNKVEKEEKNSSKIEEYYNESAGRVTGVVKSLQSDPNIILKSGVIGVSGLGGIVLGYRGGVFKKFSYMIIGAGTAAALIFPQYLRCAFNCSWATIQQQYAAIGGTAPKEEHGEKAGACKK